MIHAREDYQRIQDPAGMIPPDEPVFLIRGQDVAGPIAVLCWAHEAQRAGASAKIVTSAKVQADRMMKWQREQKAKVPDLPREPKFQLGDKVRIVRLLDDMTSPSIIGTVDTINEIEPLANGDYNYYVGTHYVHEEELEKEG